MSSIHFTALGLLAAAGIASPIALHAQAVAAPYTVPFKTRLEPPSPTPR